MHTGLYNVDLSGVDRIMATGRKKQLQIKRLGHCPGQDLRGMKRRAEQCVQSLRKNHCASICMN